MKLLKSGLKTMVEKRSSNMAWSDLLRYVEENDTKSVRELLDSKDAGVTIEDRSALLRTSIVFGNDEIMKLLLSYGIDVNDGGQCGETFLHFAAVVGNAVASQILLQHGADPNAVDFFGRTPLHFAASRGYTEVAEILAKGGANVNAQEKSGLTPLRLAVTCGHIEMVGDLVAYGADVNVRDGDGRTPLHTVACGQRKERCVKIALILIQHGADVNAQDNEGNTPLHEAARTGNADVIRLLLDSGADENVKNVKGITPLDMAKRRRKVNPELLAVFEEFRRVKEAQGSLLAGAMHGADEAPEVIFPRRL